MVSPKASLDSDMILSKNMASPSLPAQGLAEMDSIHPPWASRTWRALVSKFGASKWRLARPSLASSLARWIMATMRYELRAPVWYLAWVLRRRMRAACRKS